MGCRFRKSFKLAPGVRMNLSGSGLSWTLGPRGASVGIGKRGTFLNSGIPGTGLSSRQRIGGSTSTRTVRSVPATTHVAVTVQVADDGSVFFFDPQGDPLPDYRILHPRNHTIRLPAMRRRLWFLFAQQAHGLSAPRPPASTRPSLPISRRPAAVSPSQAYRVRQTIRPWFQSTRSETLRSLLGQTLIRTRAVSSCHGRAACDLWRP